MKSGIGAVDDLKAEGRYFEAGALARSLGLARNYGCHFGLRSELEAARDAFRRGWDAEQGQP